MQINVNLPIQAEVSCQGTFASALGDEERTEIEQRANEDAMRLLMEIDRLKGELAKAPGR